MVHSTKEQVKAWLLARDMERLLAWADGVRGAWRVLNGFTFHDDPLLRARAAEALGRFAALKATGGDLAPVRDMITRLLWSMNDESGALGWHAPEVIGEILVQVPALIGELAPHLPHFFREEPFERGAYFAVMRAAALDPGAFAAAAEPLKEGLSAQDPYIRAYAARALRLMGKWPPAAEDLAARIEGDAASLELYDPVSGDFKETTVSKYLAD